MSKLVRKTQQGFAMLEVLLAVIVIAMVSFGVYQLYKSSQQSSQLSAAESAVTQIMSAAGQYVSQNYAQVTSTGIIDANLVPDTIVNSSSDNFISPYGTIELTGSSSAFQSYYVAVAGVPGPSQQSFCTDMSGSYDVGTSATAKVTCSSLSDATSAATLYVVNPKGSLS